MARTQLAMQLGSHAVPFPSIEALAAKLNGTPLVVVLGPSMASPDQLVVVERLTRPRPEVGAILIAEQLTTDVLQQALRAGVRDVLPLQDLSQLSMTVKRVGDMLSAGAPPTCRRSWTPAASAASRSPAATARSSPSSPPRVGRASR